jgi:hypothetical protein
MISLATETERTLFFDFLPLDLGEIRGFKTRFHLYTVPGQVFYDASRKLILKGVDGVVFVADSQIERMEANIESIRNLEGQPARARLRPPVDPLRAAVQQARPARTWHPSPTCTALLNYKREPDFRGRRDDRPVGVFDTLKAVAKQILVELRKR